MWVAHERQDLYSFGTRETSSGNIPTCCLWLGLIPYAHGGSRRMWRLLSCVGRVFEPLDSALLGRLAPPYIGGRGRLTCRDLVGYKLVSSSITSRQGVLVLH